ncbi:ABC transporter ATP-binding protein [Gordonia sp. ABSL11-1]|uniref:dipeptide ABC transporter ATP-binding protein n=1 Tax=Gordonia sp. ABSL11-1 TaxID=3053924 RepID=UPI00257272E8|nr:ABC transporter ATP-binding protein [Gordonia sp. ABSL11-1]MDL9948137.1 ABC transporter ATP-binding protein [Gordonia sp. ABSL11-1]
MSTVTEGLSAPASNAGGTPSPLLRVENLRIGFAGRRQGRHTEVVHGVSFEVQPGECLAIVGESGSGKSVIARSILGLAGPNSSVSADALVLNGHEPLRMRPSALRRLRGADVGLVLQDALVSLDPLRPIGKEIDDALRIHTKLPRARRRTRVVDLLGEVGIPEPEQRIRQRSGELSGGLRQRALIASAVALHPPLLIADEPTTALDATVAQQVLELIARLAAEGAAVILISHDLAVVSRLAKRVAVIHDGVIVEAGATDAVLGNPQAAYTKRLLSAVATDKPRGVRLSPDPIVLPRQHLQIIEDRRDGTPTSESEPIVAVRNVVKRFTNPDKSQRVAVDDASLEIRPAETLGLVGESGSGKTTLARIVLGIETPDSGTVQLFGQPWSSAGERERRLHRHRLAAIYQDPLGSFDPRLSVRQILVEVLTSGRRTREAGLDDRVRELLDLVGLPSAVADRLPLRLSGGQRQRVAIARALATGPEIVVCDEPVSALDVSVQAQVLDLLDELQRHLRLSYLFISHDLGVIQHISDRVAVMQSGRIVETGDSRELFAHPQHDYTSKLLAAAPRLQAGTSTGAATTVGNNP